MIILSLIFGSSNIYGKLSKYYDNNVAFNIKKVHLNQN